jgi:hypothetical protein
MIAEVALAQTTKCPPVNKTKSQDVLCRDFAPLQDTAAQKPKKKGSRRDRRKKERKKKRKKDREKEREREEQSAQGRETRTPAKARRRSNQQGIQKRGRVEVNNRRRKKNVKAEEQREHYIKKTEKSRRRARNNCYSKSAKFQSKNLPAPHPMVHNRQGSPLPMSLPPDLEAAHFFPSFRMREGCEIRTSLADVTRSCLGSQVIFQSRQFPSHLPWMNGAPLKCSWDS